MIPESIQQLLQSFSFRGNSKLRTAGSVIDYTSEMISEYVKCKQDPIYFICKYCKVTHVDRGIVPFELYDYQKNLIETYISKRKIITMQPRQSGKTQVSAAFLLWYILFNDNKVVAILANKAAIARETLQRIQFMFEELPKWIQSGVKSWNKGSIDLENGSRILCAATTSSGLRGYSLSCIYLDEFAIIPNNIADEFLASMFPTISSGKETKIIISSTPLGYNHFQKMWKEAEMSVRGEDGGNGFTPVRVHWYDHPDRDEKWKQDQLELLGELKFSQEVLCEFLGSSMTLLSGSTLARLTHSIPIKEYTDQYKGMKVYKNPEKDRIYSISVDVSRGRHLDNSAFIVYDITQYPHTIAATYKNPDVPPLLFASLIQKVGISYNNAYLLIEINDIGGQVADTLWNDLEYENMHWTKAGDNLGKAGSDPYPGIRTTKKTKRIGCANLKDMIDNNQLLIEDYDFIHELSTFVQSKTGSYEADEGFHDDLVMCGVLHAWLVSQRFFNELTDQNLRESMHANHVKELEDQICMTTFFSDGVDEAIQHEESSGWAVY